MQFDRELSYFIEEDDSPLCQLEPTRSATGGAGKRALLMPKELALAQRRGYCRAIDANEWFRGPLTAFVDRAGNKCLPRACFTGY